ncbi:hypothetical protein NUM3379_34780 [Kineococcus sp. NUM-3379]
MEVVVEVGDWEHQCCGSVIERNEILDLGCIRWSGQDGRVRLIETHHHIEPDVRVRGRVTDLHVVEGDGVTRPILRIPSGDALRGVDPHDDGHLEDPWTGEELTSRSENFLVTVQTFA